MDLNHGKEFQKKKGGKEGILDAENNWPKHTNLEIH